MVDLTAGECNLKVDRLISLPAGIGGLTRELFNREDTKARGNATIFLNS